MGQFFSKWWQSATQQRRAAAYLSPEIIPKETKGTMETNETIKHLQSATQTNVTTSTKPKLKYDPTLHLISKQNQQTIVRPTDTMHEQPLAIEDCCELRVIVIDSLAQVTVDSCQHCTFVIGPCNGSVFMRDIQDCIIVVSCQQFRLRDAKNCQIWLHCTTQPVIESSQNLVFHCFASYRLDSKQIGLFQRAGLLRYTNPWYDIYDFTRDQKCHYRCVSEWTEPPDSCYVEKPRDYVEHVPFTQGTTCQGTLVLLACEKEQQVDDWRNSNKNILETKSLNRTRFWMPLKADWQMCGFTTKENWMAVLEFNTDLDSLMHLSRSNVVIVSSSKLAQFLFVDSVSKV